ncbi:hypothetical protein VP01_90g3 [Puccinia sorghi]|uniref:Uncharacterized protein n=1 Tax=Puccinia sorghi TaxID=27349 RepID=A0A0L6U7K8_9BASI|nr:hypothetical protein VP01_90g3 [Puccinia sorghi]
MIWIIRVDFFIYRIEMRCCGVFIGKGAAAGLSSSFCLRCDAHRRLMHVKLNKKWRKYRQAGDGGREANFRQSLGGFGAVGIGEGSFWRVLRRKIWIWLHSQEGVAGSGNKWRQVAGVRGEEWICDWEHRNFWELSIFHLQRQSADIKNRESFKSLIEEYSESLSRLKVEMSSERECLLSDETKEYTIKTRGKLSVHHLHCFYCHNLGPSSSFLIKFLSAMCMKLGGSNGYAKYYHCAKSPLMATIREGSRRQSLKLGFAYGEFIESTTTFKELEKALIWGFQSDILKFQCRRREFTWCTNVCWGKKLRIHLKATMVHLLYSRVLQFILHPYDIMLNYCRCVTFSGCSKFYYNTIEILLQYNFIQLELYYN